MKILLEVDDLELSQLEICAEQAVSRRVWIRNTSGLTKNPDLPQYYFRGQMWIKPLVTLTGGFIPLHGAISLNLSQAATGYLEGKHDFSCWHNTYLERLSLYIQPEIWLRLLDFRST